MHSFLFYYSSCPFFLINFLKLSKLPTNTHKASEIPLWWIPTFQNMKITKKQLLHDIKQTSCTASYFSFLLFSPHFIWLFQPQPSEAMASGECFWQTLVEKNDRCSHLFWEIRRCPYLLKNKFLSRKISVFFYPVPRRALNIKICQFYVH